MAIENLPYIRIYKGDYLRSAAAGCTLEAQGLYFRIRFVMSDSERYGYLQMNGASTPPGSVARRCGVPQELYESLLQELLAAGAFELTRDQILFCEEMVAEDKERKGTKKRVKSFRAREAAQGNATVTPGVTADVTQPVTPNEDEHDSESEVPDVPRETPEKAGPRFELRKPEAATLIVASYPLQVKIPLAKAETELALARLRQGEMGGLRMSEDDAFHWLAGRVKAFAKSPQGQSRFAPDPDRWMHDSRYLDDEEAWYARDENQQRQKQSVQQASDVLDARRARRMAHAARTGD